MNKHAYTEMVISSIFENTVTKLNNNQENVWANKVAKLFEEFCLEDDDRPLADGGEL